ncbi:MAG TPA: hypothetical protein VIE43_08085 [Thermoanaerobaculia bacterium]|nr:hypothetical protein [Thermoanaerobaculia bacterium]
MRKVLLVGFAALFISIAGLAQTPSPAPLSPEVLAAILGQPAVPGEQTSSQIEAAKSALPTKSTCTASCPFGVSVSCTGTGSCSSVDGTSCPTKGKVVCNGVTKSCDTCYVSCRCGGFSDAFCRANC